MTYTNEKTISKEDFIAKLLDLDFPNKFYNVNYNFIQFLSLDKEDVESEIIVWCLELYNNMEVVREVGCVNLAWFHCYLELLKKRKKKSLSPDVIYSDDIVDFYFENEIQNEDTSLFDSNDYDKLLTLIKKIPKKKMHSFDLEDAFLKMKQGYSLRECMKIQWENNNKNINLSTFNSFEKTIRRTLKEELFDKYNKK